MANYFQTEKLSRLQKASMTESITNTNLWQFAHKLAHINVNYIIKQPKTLEAWYEAIPYRTKIGGQTNK